MISFLSEIGMLAGGDTPVKGKAIVTKIVTSRYAVVSQHLDLITVTNVEKDVYQIHAGAYPGYEVEEIVDIPTPEGWQSLSMTILTAISADSSTEIVVNFLYNTDTVTVPPAYREVLASATFVPGSLARAMTDAIDNRIAGLTASDTTKLIFLGDDTRNPDCWGANINLTGYVRRNRTAGGDSRPGQAGCAITDRATVFAWHFPVEVDWAQEFIAADGTVVSRTIASVHRIGSTDIGIAILSSALPASITPFKVFPANIPNFLPNAGSTYRVPLAYGDQTRKLLVADCGTLTPSQGILTPTNAQRLAFYELPVLFDSGDPIFAIIGNEAVLLGTFLTAGGGPAISANLSAIEALLTAQGAGTLSIFDTSAYPNYG